MNTEKVKATVNWETRAAYRRGDKRGDKVAKWLTRQSRVAVYGKKTRQEERENKQIIREWMMYGDEYDLIA